jgi:hypothetical protein
VRPCPSRDRQRGHGTSLPRRSQRLTLCSGRGQLSFSSSAARRRWRVSASFSRIWPALQRKRLRASRLWSVSRRSHRRSFRQAYCTKAWAATTRRWRHFSRRSTALGMISLSFRISLWKRSGAGRRAATAGRLGRDREAAGLLNELGLIYRNDRRPAVQRFVAGALVAEAHARQQLGEFAAALDLLDHTVEMFGDAADPQLRGEAAEALLRKGDYWSKQKVATPPSPSTRRSRSALRTTRGHRSQLTSITRCTPRRTFFTVSAATQTRSKRSTRCFNGRRATRPRALTDARPWLCAPKRTSSYPEFRS